MGIDALMQKNIDALIQIPLEGASRGRAGMCADSAAHRAIAATYRPQVMG